MHHGSSPFVKERGNEWDALLPAGVRRRYPAGTIIYQQGELLDSLFYVISGRVRMSIYRPDGNEKILAIIEPGNTFGESAALDELPAYVTAQAVVHSEICAFHRDDVYTQMSRDPRMAQNVVRAMARKQRLMAMQIEAMSFMRASARVALILARLARDYGTPLPDGQGQHLGLRVTHEQIANLLGMSRTTVTRIIGDLLRQGILAKRKWDLLVIDEPRLWEMSADS